MALSESAPFRPQLQRYGYRSFDRQHIVADSRVVDRARPALWAVAHQPGQVFVVEQHSEAFTDGPGLVFSALIPDMHHFNNRGGRVLPVLHQDGVANLAPGLPAAITGALGLTEQVSHGAVLAYVAGVVSHPAFTRTHADELMTPGVRVPVTADVQVWAEAVAVGREVLLAHTFGEVDVDAKGAAGRSGREVRFPVGDPRRVMALRAPSQMPSVMAYDPDREVLLLGDGEWDRSHRRCSIMRSGGKTSYVRGSRTGRLTRVG